MGRGIIEDELHIRMSARRGVGDGKQTVRNIEPGDRALGPDIICCAKGAHPGTAANVEHMLARLQRGTAQHAVQNWRQLRIHCGLMDHPFGTGLIAPELLLISVCCVAHRASWSERRCGVNSLLGGNRVRVIRSERLLTELLWRQPGAFAKRAIEWRE